MNMVRKIGVVACFLSASLIAGAKDKVWTAYDAFNTALLDSARYIYKTDTSFKEAASRSEGAAAIWCQPMYWEMSVHAWKRARKQGDKARARTYRSLIRKIYEGNKAHYCNFNFDDNNENTGWFIYDDIMWWTIALARGYETFGDKEYLEYAEKSFSRVWYGSSVVGDDGSYAGADKGGGMFWNWEPIRNPRPHRSGDGKMACINFPTVVAALTLYNNVPRSRKADEPAEKPIRLTRRHYLEKGKEIYQWGVDNLFDARTGRVADSRHGQGEPAWKVHIYNQATFIGASVLLYKATGEEQYLRNAILAADYAVGEESPEGVLPFESGIEQGIYTAIFAQYMQLLIEEGGQKQYLPFLRHTILTGWGNRDTSRNLCGGDYTRPLPKGSVIDSYSASGIPALMLLFAE